MKGCSVICWKFVRSFDVNLFGCLFKDYSSVHHIGGRVSVPVVGCVLVACPLAERMAERHIGAKEGTVLGITDMYAVQGITEGARRDDQRPGEDDGA